jgi:hypothetical protein
MEPRSGVAAKVKVRTAPYAVSRPNRLPLSCGPSIAYFAASGGDGGSGRAIVSGSQLCCMTDFVNSGSR